jgi:hypothetical protein
MPAAVVVLEPYALTIHGDYFADRFPTATPEQLWPIVFVAEADRAFCLQLPAPTWTHAKRAIRDAAVRAFPGHGGFIVVTLLARTEGDWSQPRPPRSPRRGGRHLPESDWPRG